MCRRRGDWSGPSPTRFRGRWCRRPLWGGESWWRADPGWQDMTAATKHCPSLQVSCRGRWSSSVHEEAAYLRRRHVQLSGRKGRCSQSSMPSGCALPGLPLYSPAAPAPPPPGSRAAARSMICFPSSAHNGANRDRGWSRPSELNTRSLLILTARSTAIQTSQSK